MEIRITKNEGKPHSIVYKRSNGTETWMRADDFFVRHDLSHYAIEKSLGYKNAFLGMIDHGMDIHDFEDRLKRKEMNISREAWYAENMANLFLMEIMQGELENFNTVSKHTFMKMQLDFPPLELNNEEMKAIRILLRQLLDQWDHLASDKTMNLTLEL